MAKILVIDDSVSMLAFLETHLKGAGHEIVTAENGKVALEYLRNQSFDLVITDIYMPEVDGIEVISQARKARLFGRLIAISSADSPTNLLPVARAMGALQTLQKPFSAEQIIEAVEAVLKRPAFVVDPAFPCQKIRKSTAGALSMKKN